MYWGVALHTPMEKLYDVRVFCYCESNLGSQLINLNEQVEWTDLYRYISFRIGSPYLPRQKASSFVKQT